MKRKSGIILLLVVAVTLFLATSCLPDFIKDFLPGLTTEGIIGVWSAKLEESGEYIYFSLYEDPLGFGAGEYGDFTDTFLDEYFYDTEYVIEFKEAGVVEAGIYPPEGRKQAFLDGSAEALLHDFEVHAEADGMSLAQAKEAFLNDKGKSIEDHILSEMEKVWEEEIIALFANIHDTLTYSFENNVITIFDEEDTILLLKDDVITFKADQETYIPEEVRSLEFKKK